jgi:hypothetical protein
MTMGGSRFEDRLQAREHCSSELLELRPAMVDGGVADRPQDAVGHGRGTQNLQEMATRHAVTIAHALTLRNSICVMCSRRGRT